MFPKIYINKFIFSNEVQFGLSGATASSSHLQILPLLCIIEESPSLKMYGHKLWQSPAVGRAGRAKFGSLDQTGSKTASSSWPFNSWLQFMPQAGRLAVKCRHCYPFSSSHDTRSRSRGMEGYQKSLQYCGCTAESQLLHIV